MRRRGKERMKGGEEREKGSGLSCKHVTMFATCYNV